jgi:hypothetical protein
MVRQTILLKNLDVSKVTFTFLKDMKDKDPNSTIINMLYDGAPVYIQFPKSDALFREPVSRFRDSDKVNISLGIGTDSTVHKKLSELQTKYREFLCTNWGKTQTNSKKKAKDSITMEELEELDKDHAFMVYTWKDLNFAKVKAKYDSVADELATTFNVYYSNGEKEEGVKLSLEKANELLQNGKIRPTTTVYGIFNPIAAFTFLAVKADLYEGKKLTETLVDSDDSDAELDANLETESESDEDSEVI